MNSSSILLNSMKTITIMLLTLFISFLFDIIGFNEANIILIFTLGVLFTAQFTDFFIYGVISSLVAVQCFNFFFTAPRYSFDVYDADYLITFFMMLLATIITSILTTRVKKVAQLAKMRETRINLLYKSNKKLLLARSVTQIVDYCGESLVTILQCDVAISLLDAKKQLLSPYFYSCESNSSQVVFFESSDSIKNMNQVIQQNHPLKDESLDMYYYPICGKSSTLGVIGVSLLNKESLDENELTLLKSISTQVAFALEREHLYEQHKQANLEAERERLRGNLLRSISHDLRTPLTSILGSTSTLIQNDVVLNQQTRLELLENIYDETSWLTHSIENILSMTKIDEGRLELKKNFEILDEIITESMTRIQRFHSDAQLNIEIPDDLLLLNVDAILLETVLVNLLDNAIRFSGEENPIIIKVSQTNNLVTFQIIDQGPGISQKELSLIFDRFYTKANTNFVDKKGIGLGLAICKSIIEAHDGTIRAYNNPIKGCTFEFTIPIQEDSYGD